MGCNLAEVQQRCERDVSIWTRLTKWRAGDTLLRKPLQFTETISKGDTDDNPDFPGRAGCQRADF